MANKNYTYPRITITTNAKRHSVNYQEPVDTTVLFQPIKAKKGPVDRLVKVHSYDEYVKIFGDIDFETQGQTALNLRNWLTNNGTGLIYRLCGTDATIAAAKVIEMKLDRTPTTGSGVASNIGGTGSNNTFTGISVLTNSSSTGSAQATDYYYAVRYSEKVAATGSTPEEQAKVILSIPTPELIDFDTTENYADIAEIVVDDVGVKYINFNIPEITSVAESNFVDEATLLAGNLGDQAKKEEVLFYLNDTKIETGKSSGILIENDVNTIRFILNKTIKTKTIDDEGDEGNPGDDTYKIDKTESSIVVDYTIYKTTEKVDATSENKDKYYDIEAEISKNDGSTTISSDKKIIAAIVNSGVNTEFITAKQPGSYYNDLSVAITKFGLSKCQLVVTHNTNGMLESFGPVAVMDLLDIVNSQSDYITVDKSKFNAVVTSSKATFMLSGGSDSVQTQNALMLDFWNDNSKTAIAARSEEPIDILTSSSEIGGTIYSAGCVKYKVSGTYRYTDKPVPVSGSHTLLGQKLESHVDLICDAGYDEDIKDAIARFTSSSTEGSTSRPDIMVYFDEYVHELSNNKFIASNTPRDSGNPLSSGESFEIEKETNRAMFTQYLLVNDADVAGDVYVTATYFLTKLTPYNDTVNGIQFPIAGITRGKIDNLQETVVRRINKILNPDEKENYFVQRINYIEKDSHGYMFMSQRTYDGSTDDAYTALSFVNNRRCLNKMLYELEDMGREYLFEFNDAVTLSNMSAALNAYMENWVTNRTLNYALVEVSQSEYSDEAVDVNLIIRFTGTIEIINVSITIE